VVKKHLDDPGRRLIVAFIDQIKRFQQPRRQT